ncbi:MAG: hypothetical protein CM1200mP2_36720 [Planctomycetaceae bacterium]|nr:MAG: hypothetical protein CM1200mP2_36720 [Planctomycetaceae bacterium]
MAESPCRLGQGEDGCQVVVVPDETGVEDGEVGQQRGGQQRGSLPHDLAS